MTKFTDVRGCLAGPIDCGSVLFFKQGSLCSTSYPRENQVDGSPLVAIPSLFKNVEKIMKFSNFHENLEMKTPEF